MVMINKRKASKLNKIISGVLALSFALGMTLLTVLPVYNNSRSAPANTTTNRPLAKVANTQKTQFNSLVGQAQMAEQAKKWAEAVNFLEQAFKIKQDKKTREKLATAYLNLAKELKTNHQEAVTLLNKAVDTAPNSTAALEAKQLLNQHR